MSRLITGSLMLALSAFSFFCNAEFSENMPDWVEPKSEKQITFACGYNQELMPLESFSVCTDLYLNYSIERIGAGTGDCYVLLDPSETISHEMNCRMTWPLNNGGTASTVYTYTGGWVYRGSGLSKSCPPDDFPDYKKGPMPEPGNESHEVCFPNFPLCPLGYFKYSVELHGCVPIQCPSKGEVSSSIQTFGKVPVDGAGTYCDGQCSYSINNGVSYKGSQWATGVSNGAVCGQGKVESNANFTPEDKEGDCTTHQLSNGLTFQDCSNAADPDNPDDGDGNTDSDDTIDTTENEVEETSTDSPYDGVDCSTVDDKTTCIGKNIVDALSDQSNKLKEDAAERHNKLINQQKEISEYVERKQSEREVARQSDANQIVQGLESVRNAIVDGGSGAGGAGSNEGVISAIDGLGESVGETGVETDSEPSAGIQSFYEPEYPNGFADVWSKNKAIIDQTEMMVYLNTWKVTASGQSPDFQMCFDLGPSMNFGCKSFELDPRLFPFLRIIILVSTAFLCRALIFGG